MCPRLDVEVSLWAPDLVLQLGRGSRCGPASRVAAGRGRLRLELMLPAAVVHRQSLFRLLLFCNIESQEVDAGLVAPKADGDGDGALPVGFGVASLLSFVLLVTAVAAAAVVVVVVTAVSVGNVLAVLVLCLLIMLRLLLRLLHLLLLRLLPLILLTPRGLVALVGVGDHVLRTVVLRVLRSVVFRVVRGARGFRVSSEIAVVGVHGAPARRREGAAEQEEEEARGRPAVPFFERLLSR
jgi:hypothetical protein